MRLTVTALIAGTVRIGEVLAGEVHAGKIVAVQLDSGQIVGLVAGRRVELGEANAAAVKSPPERAQKLAPRISAPVRLALVNVRS